MLRIEAAIRNDKNIPLSSIRIAIDQISPKVRSRDTGLVRHTAARELNLSGYQLLIGCVCFLGAAKLLLWAVLKL
jgi:hypothetical protein